MPQGAALKTRAEAPADEMAEVALQLEGLVRAVVEPEVDRLETRLQSEFVQRVARAEGDLREEQQRELRRLHEPARARHWRPDDPLGWQQGDIAAHDGGTWICTASRGAGDEEPDLHASAWLLASDGISDVKIVSSAGGTLFELRATLTSGKELRHRIHFDMPVHHGGWQARAYPRNAIVARNGGAFIAGEPAGPTDDPNDHGHQSSPWRLLAMRGKRGEAAGAREIAALRADMLDYLQDSADCRSAKERATDAIDEAQAWLDVDQRAWDRGPGWVLIEFARRAIGGAVVGIAGRDAEAAAYDLGERVGRNVIGAGRATLVIQPGGGPGAVGSVAVAPRGLIEISPDEWADIRDSVLEVARSAYDASYRRRLTTRLRRTSSAKNNRLERCARVGLGVLLGEVV